MEVLISCISFNIYWPKKYQTQNFRIFHNLRSGVISFFACVAREGKNNAWYIYLTSSQPPPNLHNLTFAWPVMFLANKRLPYGNQILARIMSLLKSVLGENNFLNTSVFRWRFVKKKKLMCCFCDEILLAGAVVPLWIATNNKEFTG